ncbi:uncharacterized protein LOC141902682 [Tubulanus polymorphus]|uniref:uncharacterized protein LOC141902682 n=1 Tax=Tubulanus polymorphus TaxID=672921 RepID=UPI003DA694BB
MQAHGPGRSVRQSSMAQLHRFVKLHDRFDTQIFTFVVPGTIVKEYSPDVYSRDFMYGYQKWVICFVRSDLHVGTFLSLRNVTDGMACTIDYAFTILNKEHFTKNEGYLEKDCNFTAKEHTRGRKNLIGVNDLVDRHFLLDEDKIIIELEMRNIRTSFEQILQLPRDIRDQQNVANNFQKFETSYFAFGGFDWGLSIFPNGDCSRNEGRPMVHLNRQTSFDHCCKVRYQVILGHGDKELESDVLEDYFDVSGSGVGSQIGANVYSLTTNKGKLKCRVELLSVSAVSEVQICPLDRRRNRSRLYDRDKQAWQLEALLDGAYLHLQLNYADIYNIPRHYARYVCWSCSIIPISKPDTTKRRPIKALGTPFYNYYTQKDADEGFGMLTNIPVKEVNGPDGVYLEPGSQKLTIQVEWLDSHLLLYDGYHPFDDISRLHKHQMRREIMALQAENYALEKQVYSYQQSIAKKDSKSRYPEDHLALKD